MDSFILRMDMDIYIYYYKRNLGSNEQKVGQNGCVYIIIYIHIISKITGNK